MAGTLNLLRNKAVGFIDWLGGDVTTAKKLGAILCSRQILNTGLLDVPLSTTLNDAPGSSDIAALYHFVIAVWRAKEAESAVMIALPMRRWTMVGLALALFSMPFVIGLFTAFRVPLTTQNVLLREIILFALAALVLFIIRRKERLGWDSVGLQRPALGNTAIWVLITFVGVALAITLAFGFIKLFGLPMGNVDSKAYDALPTWVLLVVIIRAGFVEELFYRGYAIERLQSVTDSRIFAAGIPLVIFAVSHYRQGQAGIIIAMLTGAVLTAVYLYKRNLWITIAAHFLGDFIPNILAPLFAAKQ